MIEKKTVTGAITVLEDGQIQLRTDTVFLDDGVEVARTYHRRVLEPNNDTSALSDARLKAVASAVWTKAVVDEFIRKRNAATSAPPVPPAAPVKG